MGDGGRHVTEFRNRIVGEGIEAPDQLLANPFNFRRHPKAQLEALEGALQQIGWIQRVLVNRTTGHMIDGHARVELAIKRGEPGVPVTYVELTDEEERLALATFDPISGMAWHDEQTLAALLDGLTSENESLNDFLASITPGKAEKDEVDRAAMRTSLAEQFLVPPFSILDARQGYWQDRKRKWLGIGIKSELGRGQDGDKGKGGLTFSVSAQPPDVLERKKEIEARDGRTYTWTEFAEAYPNEITLAGDSIFDPVLCEIGYRWFAPKGGTILDPFAGGSVRGVVAGMLGYRYTGIDLRPEQVQANQRNWEDVAADGGIRKRATVPDNMPALTPVERRGEYLFKRDDTWAVAGSRGGKARACWLLCQGATGLVTAGSRQSPQVNLVAQIAQRLGVPCRVHVPTGDMTPELIAAQAAGAEVIQHKPGHNSVIIARAREDAKERGWKEIPFGMECAEAVEQTAAQVENLPWGDFERIVIPVGSGMNLAGLLHGLKRFLPASSTVKVFGLVVGADPTKRLDKWAPEGWRDQVELVQAAVDYHEAATETTFEGIDFDPIYEAKCLPFLRPGDLMWAVGIRQSAVTEEARPGDPTWIAGDSRDMDRLLPADDPADLIFSCPPYADLEVYSDDPRDISNMGYEEFIDAYRDIIRKACARLRDNRFAVFVVGDVRDRAGIYRNFVGDTVKAFEDAGLGYYNEACFITPTGSLAMRAGNMFRASRKMGKAHQNVLIFAKGEPDQADPMAGLGAFLARHFEEHRSLLQAHEKVLVFAKGDPKAAADEFGPVLTMEGGE